MITNIKIQDRFFNQGRELRSVFDSRFANPLEGHSERFVWDYWHVPDQYTLLRTPAEHYFTDDLFQNFVDRLCSWGQKHLGCSQISPPWLSCYIDGCEQQLHADNPHGPWAFVYSLTNWSNRSFAGGQTYILKDHLLNYWPQSDFDFGYEKNHLMQFIEPEFNRLTVFDPSYPHGVEPVKGGLDPRQSRLVIHGWFTDPAPYFAGALDELDCDEVLNSWLVPYFEKLQNQGRYQGILTLEIAIEPTGHVQSVSPLTSNLKPLDTNNRSVPEIIGDFTGGLRTLQFAKKESGSTITLPIVFG